MRLQHYIVEQSYIGQQAAGSESEVYNVGPLKGYFTLSESEVNDASNAPLVERS